MSCPKCKAKIGVMKHEIMIETGSVKLSRCIICGYWSQPYHPGERNVKVRQKQTAL